MGGLRPEFEAALRLFGRASDAMVALGRSRPVLVGGAAVEMFTSGAVTTGDFDIVTAWQEDFERVLLDLGFSKPSGRGMATRGWVYPSLAVGFEVVSSTLFGGLADREKVVLVELGGDGAAAFVSVEDVIADRVAQFGSGSAPEMLEQARRLFGLHGDVDRTYLARRLDQETGGEFGLEDLSTHNA